ncbi:calcium-binding protein [Pseudoruegeria sp. HB172150]|uniref:calcium-binding protein n=1 Tax=Pseudoruegeria sp. HB172150 TaxID=2721164 RepID=UPI00155744FE|nr:calcium-binding protein [Pseudoruegeria sp. HB172150]
MASISHVATLSADAEGVAAPVVGLELFETADGPLLQGYTAEGAVRGTWQLDVGGTEAHDPGEVFGISSLELGFSGTSCSLTDDQLARLAEAGTLRLALDGAGPRVEAAWIDRGDTGWLFVEDPEGGIARFGIGDAALAGGGVLAVEAADVTESAGVDDFVFHEAAGHDFLIGVSAAEDRVSVWEVAADGGLAETGRAPSGIGLSSPEALAAVTVGGAGYVVTAGSGSGSLSVFALTEDGGLRLTDHVLDDGATRFRAASHLRAVELDGRAYLVAAGNDGGISVLGLMPGGELVHLASLDGVAAISALTVTVLDGEIRIFAASETETGVSEIVFDPEAGLILTGGNGDDTLDGGDGDDILRDGAGRDEMTGGAGADLFVLSADGTPDVIRDFDPAEDRLDLSRFELLYALAQLGFEATADGAVLTYRDERVEIVSAAGTPLSLADFSDDTILNLNRPPKPVLRCALDGEAGADRLVGSEAGMEIRGYDGADVLVSLGGDNLLDGGSGEDCADYSAAGFAVAADLAAGLATLGADWTDRLVAIEDLAGSRFGDVLGGDDGANEIAGMAGADRAAGGGGADLLTGGAGIDTLEGGDGDDEIIGNTASDYIYGGEGNDSLYGGEGRDSLYGDDGDDLLMGGTGGDRLEGGDGADMLFGSAGSDVLIGGDGGDDLRGATGADLLMGGAGDDTLTGSQGFDTLEGGDGDDSLSGGSRADRLDGGAGNDTLKGGVGADVFVFRDGGGRDVIRDFALAGDRLLLDAALCPDASDAAQILSEFGFIENGNAVLDFGDGDRLILTGVGDLDALGGDIAFL